AIGRLIILVALVCTCIMLGVVLAEIRLVFLETLHAGHFARLQGGIGASANRWLTASGSDSLIDHTSPALFAPVRYALLNVDRIMSTDDRRRAICRLAGCFHDDQCSAASNSLHVGLRLVFANTPVGKCADKAARDRTRCCAE